MDSYSLKGFDELIKEIENDITRERSRLAVVMKQLAQKQKRTPERTKQLETDRIWATSAIAAHQHDLERLTALRGFIQFATTATKVGEAS